MLNLSSVTVLVVTYESKRKIVIHETNTSLSAFKLLLKALFAITEPEAEIKLYDIIREAEITSERLFQADHEIKIVIEKPPVPLPLDSNFLASSEDANKKDVGRKDKEKVNPLQISFDELISKKFAEKTFLSEINKWALKYKFKVRFGEGLKETNKEYKRILVCSTVNCTYKLTFTSPNPTENFRINEKLSKNYMKRWKRFLSLLIKDIFRSYFKL